MNLPCEIVLDLVSIYKDNLASDYTAAAVEAHLKSCPVCRKYYKQYDSILRIQAAKSDPAEDFFTGSPAFKEFTDLSVKLRMRRKLCIAGVTALTLAAVSSIIISNFHTNKKDI